jgi:hypothetical protein
MSAYARLAAFAAAALLAACSPTPSDLPLRLTVTPADTLAPGDSLRMTAILRNPGKQPVRLEFDTQCQVEFYVHAPDKTVLYPPGSGTTCIRAPTVVELAAGDSLRFDAQWMATSATSGPHTAYAVLWEHYLPRDGDEREFDPGHRSNIVQFEVTKAP